MGVVFAKPDKNDRIIAVAKNEESAELADDDEPAAEDSTPGELSAESGTVAETPEDMASDQAESAETDEADGAPTGDDDEDA
jgi:DNA gyrase subunit A